MLSLPLLQIHDSRQGQRAILLSKLLLHLRRHCNVTEEDCFSITFIIDLMPASQPAAIQENYYKRPQLLTEWVGFSNPLPEGYEPSPSRDGTFWRSNKDACAAGGVKSGTAGDLVILGGWVGG